MGAFQRLIDQQIKENNMGLEGDTSKWKAFYGKEKVDRKLNRMLDQIERYVGDAPVYHIFVHKDTCSVCKNSIPKFKKFSSALKERLPNYTKHILELKEPIRLDGTRTDIKGIDLYKYFKNQTKGVPFVLQNGKVDKSRGMYLPNGWHVAYVGKFVPFRFFASTFDVENTYVSED